MVTATYHTPVSCSATVRVTSRRDPKGLPWTSCAGVMHAAGVVRGPLSAAVLRERGRRRRESSPASGSGEACSTSTNHKHLGQGKPLDVTCREIRALIYCLLRGIIALDYRLLVGHRGLQVPALRKDARRPWFDPLTDRPLD